MKKKELIPLLIIVLNVLILGFCVSLYPDDNKSLLNALVFLIFIDYISYVIYKYLTSGEVGCSTYVYATIFLFGLSYTLGGSILSGLFGLIALGLVIYGIVTFIQYSSSYDSKDIKKVYISINGNVYHKYWKCGGNTLPIEMTEREALDKGYYKCSKCW